MVYLIKNTITSRGGYEGKLFADLWPLLIFRKS
jgi:hypothetical protein